MLNRFALPLAVLVTATVPANANGFNTTRVSDPVYVEPAVSAFEGAYAGLEFGQVTGVGDGTAITAGGPVIFPGLSFSDGRLVGAFAGYNLQRGNIVYGGEIRYLSFNDFEVGGFSGDDVIDLRGRLGLAHGSFMFYGALGWSYGSVSRLSGSTDDGGFDGVNYGLGVEYNASDRVMIGLDYTAREIEGSFSSNFDYDGDLETVSFRIGLRF